jgi:hypothetical protein
VFLFFAAAPLFTTAMVIAAVRWWVRASRVAAVLEVAGGELLFTRPGLWRTERRRAPLAEVRDVVIRILPTIGRKAQVRVSVVFRRRWRKVDQIFLSDPAVAEHAKAAFAEALAMASDEKA